MASVIFFGYLFFVGLCLCVLHGTASSNIIDSDDSEKTEFAWDDNEVAEMTRTAVSSLHFIL